MFAGLEKIQKFIKQDYQLIGAADFITKLFATDVEMEKNGRER